MIARRRYRDCDESDLTPADFESARAVNTFLCILLGAIFLSMAILETFCPNFLNFIWSLT